MFSKDRLKSYHINVPWPMAKSTKIINDNFSVLSKNGGTKIGFVCAHTNFIILENPFTFAKFFPDGSGTISFTGNDCKRIQSL